MRRETFNIKHEITILKPKAKTVPTFKGQLPDNGESEVSHIFIVFCFNIDNNEHLQINLPSSVVIISFSVHWLNPVVQCARTGITVHKSE